MLLEFLLFLKTALDFSILLKASLGCKNNLEVMQVTGCNSRQSNKQAAIHPKIINLPGTYPTDTQVCVLSKGLKFTPSPRRNTIETEKDIHDFTRKLRLTEFFANENDITSDEETQPPNYLSLP